MVLQNTLKPFLIKSNWVPCVSFCVVYWATKVVVYKMDLTIRSFNQPSISLSCFSQMCVFIIYIHKYHLPSKMQIQWDELISQHLLLSSNITAMFTVNHLWQCFVFRTDFKFIHLSSIDQDHNEWLCDLGTFISI